MDENNIRCSCDTNAVCGHKLRDGVKIVSLSAIAIALAFLLTGLILVNVQNWETVSKEPINASLLTCSLVSICMSPYQIGVSLLLLWQVYRNEGDIFICSVWYISHINIMIVYFILVTSISVTCFLNGQALSSYIIDLFLILYEAMLFYCCSIVNNYMNALPRDDRYL